MSVPKTAFKIALMYSVVGALWILFSDQAAAWVAPEPELFLLLSTLKGWLFIVVTTLLLYATVQHYLHRLQRVNEALAAAYEEIVAGQAELQEKFAEVQETERELRASEERFHSLFVSMGEGVALHELLRNDAGAPTDYRIMEINRSYEKILGIDRGDVVGKTAKEAYKTAEAPYLAEYSRVAVSRQPMTMDVYFAPLDKHFSISVAPWGTDGFATVFTDTSRRKRAERELQESETKFRLVADFTYDWEYWIAPAGDIRYMSPSSLRLTGYKRDQFIDQPCLLTEILHPEDREELQHHFTEIRHTESQAVDFRIMVADRSIRWIAMRYQSVFDEAGTWLGRRYSCRDITERIHLETFIRMQSEDLQRLNERFALAADSAGIGVWDLDIRHDKLFWDDTMHELYGLTPGEFNGDSNAWLRVVYPKDRKNAFREYRQAVQGEKEYDSEFRVVWPDGSIRYLKAFGRVARDADGTPIRMTGVNYDISKSKTAEAALRDSENRYRVLTESMRDAVWVLDVWTMYFTYISPSVQRIQGFPAEELITLPLDSALLPEDREPVKALLRSRAEDFLSGKEPPDRYYVGELRQPRRDGSYVWTEVISRFFLNEETGRVEIWGVSQDITLRKQAETALRESEARYRAILQQSHDAIALVDMGSKLFLEVNAFLLDLLGYSAEEISKLTLFAVTDDPDIHSAEFFNGILSGREKAATLRQFHHKLGRAVNVELSASVIQYAGKQVFLFAGRDVTEERKLQEKVRQEVKIAAELQKNILPRDFRDVLLAMESIYVPYHVVSGDFYDYAWSPNHQKFSGYILDISGHGVASSLQGIAVSAYFREVLASPMRLSAKLAWINRHVLRYFTEDTYAAAIYFEFDFSRNILTYGTAGIYGFLASTATLSGIVTQAGSFIGITEETEYGEGVIPFASGDAFYFMSDGIFDQISRVAKLPVADFAGMTACLQELATGEDRRDDCCALCIRINGRPALPVRFELHRSGEYGRIRARIRELLRELAGDHAAKLDVAIGEALNNGVREAMEVQIKISLYGRRLVVRVRDGGAGFNGNRRVAEYFAGQDRLFEDQAMAEGGRGIYIMAAWMDRVMYNRVGNEVMLVKYLTVAL